MWLRYFELLLWVVWDIIPHKLVKPLLEHGANKHEWFPEIGKVQLTEFNGGNFDKCDF